MHYLTAEGLSKSHGVKPLFEDLTFHVEEGDKIALVARNGFGKSSLMRILAGRDTSDSGRLWIHKDVTVVFLEQDPPFMERSTVLENIFHHDHPVLDAIRDYEAADEKGDPEVLARAIERMDELGAWDFDAKVRQILGRLGVRQLHQTMETLSGGQRKRVALAKTLIDIGFEPRHVLLMMDEPTNHLDVEMVEWLESHLNRERVTLLLVTHDRYFLDSVCDEIWELDGGGLQTHKGDYADYLERKAARMESEAASIEKARNLYRRELDWMRRQPQARTTKSKSRQDRFYEVEAKAAQRIEQKDLQLQVKMTRLGGKVAELKKVYKSHGDKVILKGFDYTFKKGERVGIIGRNGAGKSTFLNILLGTEAVDSGKVNIGETVVFGHFSQQGLRLKDESIRVIEYVKGIAESFPLAGGGSLSASQFLERFLFPPEQQYTPIAKLSGGERKRLQLLSILFRNPNFLMLDEPTNDLDLPTLGVLEGFLEDYEGCLVIVSHDRYFMDRLVEHLLVFEGEGVVSDFPGNYARYREHQATVERQPSREKSQPTKSDVADTESKTPAVKKMGFKERREFENLERELKELEVEKKGIVASMEEGSLPFTELERLAARFKQLEALIDQKEMRWLELSEYR